MPHAVTITNLTSYQIAELWYVGDPGTSITNYDDFADGPLGTCLPPQGFPAFKVDSVGVNKPLIGEVFTQDGIFEPGEIWTFVVDDFDYSLDPGVGFLGSIGVGSSTTSLAGGSIVAIIPEPSTATLLVLGLAGLASEKQRPR